MRPSPSGTASPDSAPRTQTVVLLLALAVVLAFAGSAIFGLRRSEAERQAEPLPADTAPVAAVAPGGRVEVLNGAGRPGLARLVTERLRAAGFDVVNYGNAGRAADSSVVLDRVGRPDLAAAIGQAIGIAYVTTRHDSTRLVDATVILGKDWLQQGDTTAGPALPEASTPELQ